MLPGRTCFSMMGRRVSAFLLSTISMYPVAGVVEGSQIPMICHSAAVVLLFVIKQTLKTINTDANVFIKNYQVSLGGGFFNWAGMLLGAYSSQYPKKHIPQASPLGKFCFKNVKIAYNFKTCFKILQLFFESHAIVLGLIYTKKLVLYIWLKRDACNSCRQKLHPVNRP